MSILKSSPPVTNRPPWYYFLFQPVDNSPLILFRVVFGLLIALEAGGAIATGWVRRVFVEPTFTFNFIGFDFLQILVGETMYGIYAVMAVAGIMVMLGYHYRAAILTYGVLWTICYLAQKSSYNNHYYLLILLCSIMAVVPAHRYFSLDVKQGRAEASLTCPRWCLLIFVIQVAIVYFYASLAKVYPDWLTGEPIRLWFAGKADFWLIGPLLQEPWLQRLVVYGGIAFDGLTVLFLLWRPTRLYAFWIGVFFHLFNSAVFHIGIFPYMMIGICVFFFPPEKIRRWFFPRKPAAVAGEVRTAHPQQWIVAIGITYFALQLYLPLRHYLYPGNVFWTEEGHRMSWRMMLRTKQGHVDFRVVDQASGQAWDVNLADYLSAKQSRKIGARPDMIWQFAQRLEQEYTRKGYEDVAVYASAQASLNGRPFYPLVSDTVDLTKVDWTPFAHAQWIVPLSEE